MASEKILLAKQQQVADLAEKLKGATSGVLVDYKGITVEDDTKMRKELREAGVEYHVIKNGILRRACEDAGLEELKDVLVQPTAIAISDDAVAPAKIIAKYAEAGKETFNVKAGFVEGKIIDAKGVDDLAKLPSREELVGMVLRGFNAPIAGFANVLNGNLRGLAVALNAIREQKEQSA